MEAHGSVFVSASGSATVSAYDIVRVEASDLVHISASGSSFVKAKDWTQVVAYGAVYIQATDYAYVKTYLSGSNNSSPNVEARGCAYILVPIFNKDFILLHENAFCREYRFFNRLTNQIYTANKSLEIVPIET